MSLQCGKVLHERAELSLFDGAIAVVGEADIVDTHPVGCCSSLFKTNLNGIVSYLNKHFVSSRIACGERGLCCIGEYILCATKVVHKGADAQFIDTVRNVGNVLIHLVSPGVWVPVLEEVASKSTLLVRCCILILETACALPRSNVTACIESTVNYKVCHNGIAGAGTINRLCVLSSSDEGGQSCDGCLHIGDKLLGSVGITRHVCGNVATGCRESSSEVCAV